MDPIAPLADAVDPLLVGGKAWNLARLQRNGLPVPPTAVIPVPALWTAARAAGVWERLIGGGDAAGAVIGMPLPAGWAERWAAVAARLGARVAVRSSAVGEDGPEHAQAGAYHTVLDVAPADVPAAVAAVWASWWSPAAVASRDDPHAPPRMAVVLQAMVAPDAAGVLFTINPLTGSWREMVVEAVPGLGDALVDGRVTPHHWVVRRPRRLPGPLARAWTRVRLDVIHEDLPPLPGATGGALRRDEVLTLGRLALRVERAFGAPQDIEWALDRGRFVLLQARPVTRTASPRARADVLWTRRFIGERFPDPPTVLGWSILEPLFAWFIAYPDVQARYLGGGPALRLVQGRPYLNVTVFRHLSFKLPGAAPPAFMLELLPPTEADAWRKRRGVAPDLSVYGALLRSTWDEHRWDRFAWNPWTNPQAWDAMRDRIHAALPALSRPPVSPTDAVRLVDDQIALLREYCGIHLCSLLFANLCWQGLEGMLSVWAPGAPWAAALATCPQGNQTLDTNQALWTLATRASDADLDRLARGQPAEPPFRDALAAFLATYGHRSVASWELGAPRWADTPAALAPLLAAQRGAENPAIRAATTAAAHHEALVALRQALPPARRAVAERWVAWTGTYLQLRENQRFTFDALVHALQRTLGWLGTWAAARGTIADPADVWLLTWDELRHLADGSLDGSDARAWVSRRRAQRATESDEEPAVFLVGDQAEPLPATGGRWTGLGISPGRVRGRVRQIRTLADGARLQPGEILVARALDPGWTPLLLVAGGAILELGGALSHGAVVAREYGKPAVVHLEGALRRLHDGQEVTVDGSRGAVWIHP